MIATWISAVSIAVAAVVGLLNMLVTAWLTVTIHRLAERSTALEVMRRNSDQWQRLNLALIDSPALQKLLDGAAPLGPDDRLVQRNLLFYVINTIHEIYDAQSLGLIAEGPAMRLMEGQIKVLRPHADNVSELLSLQRGYDSDFHAFVQRAIQA